MAFWEWPFYMGFTVFSTCLFKSLTKGQAIEEFFVTLDDTDLYRFE